jgi:hypothetical protein
MGQPQKHLTADDKKKARRLANEKYDNSQQ